MALQGGSAEATGPIKGPPVPDSKIPPPIGRIPAAASLNRSEGPLRGGLGVGVGAWQGHAQAQAQGQGQEAQQQQGVGASSNMGLHGGVQMMPPPATGLVELLIDDWGRQPPSWSSSRK